MSKLPRLTLLVGLLAIVGACSGAATTTPGSSASPPGSPAASDPPSPAVGEIDHPTGATDVVLRYEEGGGFMMVDFVAVQAPHFTLYGDGTVIFRNPMLEAPPPQGPVMVQNPFRTAKLSEEQVQDLLEFALAEGGLAAAKLMYENAMVMDAPNTVFTVRAGGLDKVITVGALGMEGEGVPDMPAREAFKKVAERLANFDDNGSVPTDVYVPTAYRAVLIDAEGAPLEAPIAWPWADIAPSDFVANAVPEQSFPSRVMTAEELEVLGIEGIEGGFMGVSLTGPDRKSYRLSVRPLLPDEKA